MEDWKRLAKPVIIIVAVLIVLYAGWSIFTALQRHGKVKVTVNAAPSAMTLTLDNKRITTTGVVYLSPGDHEWQASFKGFGSQKGTVTVKSKKPRDLLIALQPTDATGRKWLKDHPEDGYAIEGVIGKDTDNTYTQRAEAQPFVKDLPFLGPGFEWQIDYGPTPANAPYPDQPGIFVQADTDQGRQDALDWIKADGYNPDKMNIVFQRMNPVDTTNPNDTLD